MFKLLHFSLFCIRAPLTEIRLQIVGSPDWTLFLFSQLNVGESRLLPWKHWNFGDSPENLFEIYGDSRCVWNFGSRTYFRADVRGVHWNTQTHILTHAITYIQRQNMCPTHTTFLRIHIHLRIHMHWNIYSLTNSCISNVKICVLHTHRFCEGIILRGKFMQTHWNLLQHTATHCSILQHTATHCRTLQHTAAHCHTLQHTATRCNILTNALTYIQRQNTLTHTATHCNTLQHTAAHCNTLQHTATHCHTLQHTAAYSLTRSRIYNVKTHVLHMHGFLEGIIHTIGGNHRAIHANPLQHTATYCNTLQHTATHCNTLQHTTTHCSTLQHTAAHCSTLQLGPRRARAPWMSHVTCEWGILAA